MTSLKPYIIMASSRIICGVGLFSLVFFSACSSSRATVLPVTPRIAMESVFNPMDTKTEGEADIWRRVKSQTNIRTLTLPSKDPLESWKDDPFLCDNDRVCSRCSTDCFQCSGRRFHIACTCCRNVCPPRNFRLEHGSRLISLNDGGHWEEGALLHPSRGRFLHVAGHQLTQIYNGHIGYGHEYWNKCVQARISDNIDIETSRIYEKNRTRASDLRKVAFILGLIQQSQTGND